MLQTGFSDSNLSNFLPERYVKINICNLLLKVPIYYINVIKFKLFLNLISSLKDMFLFHEKIKKFVGKYFLC